MDCQLSVDKVRASVWIEYHENIAGVAFSQTTSFLCIVCSNVQNLACVKLALIMFKMSGYSMKMALTVTITLIRTQVVQTNDLFVKKMKGEKNNSKTVTVSLTVQHEQCNKEPDIEETLVGFLSPSAACFLTSAIDQLFQVQWP